MRGSCAGRRCSARARQCALRRGLREPAAAPVVCGQVPPAYVRCARSKAAMKVASTVAATMSTNAQPEFGSCQGSRQRGCPRRTASGACKTCGNQNAGEHRCSQREPWCASRRRVRGAAAESSCQDGVQHVAARRQRSAGQDVQARQGLQRARARRRRPEVLSAHLRKAWICRAMRLAGSLASTGPSHGRGLTGRRHACCRVSLGRLKASLWANSRGVTQVKERLRPGRRRMQRLSGQRPSGSSFEKSRRSSSAAATRLVADVLELVADVLLACQCLRLDT